MLLAFAYQSLLLSSLQDRGAPDTTIKSFSGVPFNATLAIDNPKALSLVQQSGADGFSMGSDALFQVRSLFAS